MIPMFFQFSDNAKCNFNEQSTEFEKWLWNYPSSQEVIKSPKIDGCKDTIIKEIISSDTVYTCGASQVIT